MFRVENEAQLKDAFRNLDQGTVEIPTDWKFPLFVRDYLTWQESSGARTYLVVSDPENQKTLGVAFRKDAGRGQTSNHCEWCHSFGGSSEIQLLSATSQERKRVGVYLCQDLSCLQKLESRAYLSGENSRHLSQQLRRKMMTFARRYLF